MAETRRGSELTKLGVVIKREIMERVRTKWFLITTLLIPVIFAGMMVLPVWLASRTKASDQVSSIRILDATGRGLGARVARVLTSDSARAAGSRGPEVQVLEPAALAAAEDAATRDVMGRRAPGYLVLDSATVAGRSARYAGRNASTVPDVERIRGAVRQAVTADRMANAGLDSARIAEVTNVRLQMPTMRISDKGKGGAGGFGGYILGFVIAFLMYMIMALYGQQVLRGVMEEKTTRVAEVVVSSVRPVTLMAGKVLGVGAVVVIQQALWIGLTSVMGTLLAPTLRRIGETGANASAAGAAARGTGAAASNDIMAQVSASISAELMIATVVFFVLGFLFYASLYAAVGATVSSEQDAQQAAAPIAFLLVPSIVLLQPILLAPTGTLAIVMSILPFSAPIVMPMRMSMIEVPLWEKVASFASALLGCVLALWFAAKIYRVGLLMYGKRPTYGEMMKWLRYS
jgi:ABC-2 type transport system permease protein